MSTAPPPCPHGLGSAASCMTCMEDTGLGSQPQEPVREEPGARPFRARKDSTCAGCGFPLAPGEWAIAMTNNSFRHHRPGCSR